MKSWMPEVIADSSGKFCGNGMRFRTKEDAERWAHDLSMRWLLVSEWRAVESEDEPNYEITDSGEVKRIE
jgi:hypothetical protein